ncbi:efflux RND transporter periplasmic adaptor subunit [Meridianimarinicoccus roseus]|uniref:Efflux RND transporter periplasmic adaptor subunit n=1 Tax=Meridianimarinicoccus roseus TaxID=2072018 RepID=A0A2V2LB20_9RHOB|nr:efflux RND transporter periplasmic adaptor subunit [Meridianimarinicoccus roseus]PWR02690.1 efflux RND transporter periplasmic adaptor subunit [Meridianimarinicoccus roseus]
MTLLKQLALALALIAATVAGWIAYVPSATAVLDRAGLLDLLGMEAPAQEAAQDRRGQRGGDATRVVTATVEHRALADRITSIGDGQALRMVTVRAETSGRIIEVGVASGEKIGAETVIARLDDRAERIALDRARIMRDDAQADLDRLSQLADTGAVTSVRRQEAELALRTAELELAQADYDLDQRTVRAPIAGWVGLIDLEVGQRVTAQDALATITDRSGILIDFRVPERVIGQLATGQPMQVTPLAMPGTTLTGEISAIDTVVDRASRTLRVQGRLDNAADMLRSGMAFSVALEYAGDVMPAVDPLAVQWSRDGSFVWAVRDGAVARVPITIRQRNTDSVLVEGALEPGEQVVTEGLQTLRPGAQVTIEGAPADQSDNQSAATTGRRQL